MTKRISVVSLSDMNFKIIIIILLVIVYIYGLLTKYLRLQSCKNPIPANVADIYDAETYEKWRAYRREKIRLSFAESTVCLVVDVALVAFNLYAAFAGLFPKGIEPQLFAVLLLSTLTSIATLPFTYYDTMRIEEKYGFNRTKRKTFWADQIREFVISLGILFLITWILSLLHRALGDWMIVAFAGFLIVFILLFLFLYPVFSRLSNKFTPLEEGELRDKLCGLLTSHGYNVRAIEVMDASRRTSKANAYFTGYGKMKTIVLYDTLIEKLTPDEICAVFAHELGHGLNKDTLKGQLMTSLQMLILSVLAWLTLRTLAIFTDCGFSDVNYGFAVIIIMTVEFALIAPLYGILVNYFSRLHEYRADRQAVQEGYGPALISGLKKLTKTDFGDVAPSPALIMLEFSHPSLSQRIDAIEKELADRKEQ
ncbi:MAG: M48 family metallopeptidase [Lachnospiraceae bacterium]|nr:M48 family metallopeptidase [Lachnospiraceae bacterium]